MTENTCVFQGVSQSRCPEVSQSRGLAVPQSRGLVVLSSRWRASQPFSVFLSHSQSFSANRAPPSQSRAPQPFLQQPAKQKKSEPPKREAPKDRNINTYYNAQDTTPTYVTPFITILTSAVMVCVPKSAESPIVPLADVTSVALPRTKLPT